MDYNHLKPRIVVFLIVAQNMQTKHWLKRRCVECFSILMGTREEGGIRSVFVVVDHTHTPGHQPPQTFKKNVLTFWYVLSLLLDRLQGFNPRMQNPYGIHLVRHWKMLIQTMLLRYSFNVLALFVRWRRRSAPHFTRAKCCPGPRHVCPISAALHRAAQRDSCR